MRQLLHVVYRKLRFRGILFLLVLVTLFVFWPHDAQYVQRSLPEVLNIGNQLSQTIKTMHGKTSADVTFPPLEVSSPERLFYNRVPKCGSKTTIYVTETAC